MKDGDKTLLNLLSTSRFHYDICRPLVYQTLSLRTPPAAKLLKIILHDPTLAACIKHLKLDWIRDHQAMYDHSMTIAERENPTSFWTSDEWEKMVALTANTNLSKNGMLDLRRGRSFASMLIVFLQLLSGLEYLNLVEMPVRGVYEESGFIFKYLWQLLYDVNASEPKLRQGSEVPWPAGLKQLHTFGYSSNYNEPNLDLYTIFPLLLAPKLETLVLCHANLTGSINGPHLQIDSLKLKKIFLKRCDVEILSLIDLIKSCAQLQEFSYDYYLMFEVMPIDLDAHDIVDALKKHQESLTVLRLVDCTLFGAKSRGLYPVVTNVQNLLTDFTKLRDLNIDLKLLLETSIRNPDGSNILVGNLDERVYSIADVLPPNLETLTVNMGTKEWRDEKRSGGIWNTIAMDLMNAYERGQFPNLKDACLGNNCWSSDGSASFTFQDQ